MYIYILTCHKQTFSVQSYFWIYIYIFGHMGWTYVPIACSPYVQHISPSSVPSSVQTPSNVKTPLKPYHPKTLIPILTRTLKIAALGWHGCHYFGMLLLLFINAFNRIFTIRRLNESEKLQYWSMRNQSWIHQQAKLGLCRKLWYADLTQTNT